METIKNAGEIYGYIVADGREELGRASAGLAFSAFSAGLNISFGLLPNTAGATTVGQALKMARLAREATGTEWIKLEIIGDAGTLWPDPAATIEATEILVSEGFVVLPYTKGSRCEPGCQRRYRRG